ncbi:MAG: hypothetical protein KDJ99_32205 [Candidatus Competibacteraceae bacterium]|nr:hypothetical protein [Candidatus Competibacteraceae bacterium]
MAETESVEPWFPVEETLKNDASGTERDALLHKLQQQARTIKGAMDAGVSQSEFTQLNSVYTALEAASQMVTLIWGRYHNVA